MIHFPLHLYQRKPFVFNNSSPRNFIIICTIYNSITLKIRFFKNLIFKSLYCLCKKYMSHIVEIDTFYFSAYIFSAILGLLSITRTDLPATLTQLHKDRLLLLNNHASFCLLIFFVITLFMSRANSSFIFNAV